jgi:replicative DNA helicase
MNTNTEAVVKAERCALGAALLDPIAADRVVEILTTGDFLEPAHAKVFAAIAHLSLSRQPIDLVTVCALLPKEIGLAFLADLMSDLSHSGGAVGHARLVKAASNNSAFAYMGEELKRLAEAAPHTPDSNVKIAEWISERKDAIEHQMPSRVYKGIGLAEPEFMERVRDDIAAPKGLFTGFYDVDQSQGILRNGEMIVLAARPSVGKSLFASNVAENLSMSEERTPVLVFSMEMSASALYRRYMSGRSGVPSRIALGGLANDKQKAALESAHAEAVAAPWYIHDEGAMTAQRVNSISRRFQAKHGKGLIIVDYLQLMQGPGGSRYEMVTNLSGAMKAMAVDLQCPVLVLAQLNRQVDRAHRNAGEDAKPVLSDLRDSGAIEQDADVVIFLSRDTKKDVPHDCLASIAKNRPGKTGDAVILFDTNGPRFKNASKEWRGEI